MKNREIQTNGSRLIPFTLFILLDIGQSDEVAFAAAGQSGNQSLQLSLHLALKERDNSLRESTKLAEERDDLLQRMEQLRVERDRAIESLNGELAERSLEQ